MSSHTHEQIFDIVKRIPHGRVATYGQIARLAGLPGQPRLVGYALNALPDIHPDNQPVPWHRVINAKGRISIRKKTVSKDLQRALLENEGVEFDANNRISLARFRWVTENSSG